jgi:peptidyl-prolyl cis-trans isomerase D
LFGVLLATFALVGVGYGIRDLLLGGTNENEAATVGDTKITLPVVAQAYRRQLSNYQRQMGATFNPSPAERQEIARDTIDHEVTETLFEQAAQRDGIVVDDAMVRTVIEGEPSFAGPDKRFDPAHFRMLLESQGLSEATFVASVRRSLTRQLVTNPIAASAVAPRALADDIYRYRNEQRVAQLITIPNASATGIAAPGDGEIKAYYDHHPVAFTAPEYRSFTVLSLTPDLFTGEITPTDDDLHAAYDQHKAEYVDPEKRRIDQVVLPDKATAEAIAKEVASGKSLADAAKAATGGKFQPVTVDFLPRDQFPQGLQDPVFAAAEGKLTGPVETPLGWHVIVVTGIQPGHDIPFDQVKDKLVQELKHDGAAGRLDEQIDKIGDKLAGGAPMDQVAAGLGATPVRIAAVDAKGDPATAGTKTADPKAAKPDPAWTATAFTLRAGETSAIQTGKDGGYFAVRLDSVTPPALRPLQDVRADVATAWIDEQKATQTAKRAADLAAQAKSGTPFDQVASKAGLKLETSPPFSREATDTIPGAPPPAVIDAIFKLGKIGDIATVDTGDGQVIARLSEIRPADPFTAGQKLASLIEEIDGGMQADTLAQYGAALRQSTKIEINPQAAALIAGQ